MPPIRKSIAMLVMCIGFMGLVGCNQPADKFAGFASEQLSERLDIVNEKLDVQISAMVDGEKRDGELMDAIRNLASTVDELKAARNEDLQRLRDVASKAKVRLTADDPSQDPPKTLNPNDAPAAKLTLDSLDEAAEQIENLMRRVDELEKRSKAFEASQPKANYQSVSSSSSYGSTGTSFSGGSNGTNAAVAYQKQPVYYEQQPVSPPVTYQSSTTTSYSAPASSAYTCVDQYGNPVPCNQQSTQPVQYTQQRKGFFSRLRGW